MLIFLSEIFQKVFLMFSSSFSMHWVHHCHAHNISFDFVICVTGFGHVTSRVSSSHFFPLINKFVQIVKYQACSFDRPAGNGIIVKLSRSLTDSTFGMTWSFDRIVT